ncbi:MAG: hypothetical protein KAI24_20930 [Planctomycetes bacterium]|nr:hypothetical protein [Planctomycetota bacterium]
MAFLSLASVLLAPLWTWVGDGRPLRCGLRLPAEVLEQGLSLAGPGVVQWRRLPLASAAMAGEEDEQGEGWVELAIVAPAGRVQLVRGGCGPSPQRRGPAYVYDESQRRVDHGVERRQRWQWRDGTVDERVRTTFTARTEIGGEVFDVGEGWTRESAGLADRARWWRTAGLREARRCGLLPERGRGGHLTRRVQRQLAACVDALVELPGTRGAGDFARAGGEVTNNEFDTSFALLRCAVGLRHARAFGLAQRAAGQLRDRDLDQRSGLPFVHGPGHRTGTPQTGHVWLRGLLWVGLVTADDDALVAARALGRALAVNLPRGTGRNERLRDYAWPLFELESLLAVAPDPVAERAADRLAAAIAFRFDPRARTWRFGEGLRDGGVHFERAWLTAGLLLPALDAHVRRRPSEPLREQLTAARAQLSQQLGRGARGLPTHYRVHRGATFAQHYERCTVRAAWLLEALPGREQARLLGRRAVQKAIAELPQLDDADLPTTFTMLARCDWPWR